MREQLASLDPEVICPYQSVVYLLSLNALLTHLNNKQHTMTSGTHLE